MATLACVCCFSAIVTALPRFYLFGVTQNPTVLCANILNPFDGHWVWVSTFVRIVDLFLPIWALMWYFIHTVKKHAKRQDTSLDIDVYQFEDHHEGTESEFPSRKNFVQPFSPNSPYKTYISSTEHRSSEEEDPGLYTDYSGEEPKR